MFQDLEIKTLEGHILIGFSCFKVQFLQPDKFNYKTKTNYKISNYIVLDIIELQPGQRLMSCPDAT